MNVTNLFRFAIAACLLLATPSFAGDWEFQFEPYLMISNIEGDAGIGPVEDLVVDVDFSTILENLDLGAMAHFEAHHKSGWGLSLDYGFMDLGADISGPRGGILDASVRQGVFEALVVKRKRLAGGTLDWFAGVRWWDNDIDVHLEPMILPGEIDIIDEIDVAIGADWIDLVAGLRLLKEVNEKWKFMLRGDVGGLGAESDFTSTVAIGAQYQISEKTVLDLQYKGTWVDYETGTSGEPGYFAYDTLTHGTVLGVIFNL